MVGGVGEKGLEGARVGGLGAVVSRLPSVSPVGAGGITPPRCPVLRLCPQASDTSGHFQALFPSTIRRAVDQVGLLCDWKEGLELSEVSMTPYLDFEAATFLLITKCLLILVRIKYKADKF